MSILNSIQELTKNFEERIGKTWRKNRFYYSSLGKRIGNKIIDNNWYYSYKHKCFIKMIFIQCKIVTENDCYGLHYDPGDYPGCGWKECVRRKSAHIGKRMSSKRRRLRELRLLNKEIEQENYIC